MHVRQQGSKKNTTCSDREFWDKVNQVQSGGAVLQAPSEKFGKYVFNHSVMQKMLPPEIFANLIKASQGVQKIRPEYADTIAVAMKEWALTLGATHFCHLFYPLTGASAEKHDSFIEWSTISDSVVEKFTGKELVQGEPDASSFPSGGLRTTYEARGYTGWDPSSPAFVWKGGDGVTLCIPSVFFSWTGDVLDYKIPLLRSEKALSDATKRVLDFTGIQCQAIFSTLGLEQEYFVIDRPLKEQRPDLVLTGRTLYGASSPKGQELQDHYFGSVKDRILSYMHDFETKALELGVPVKTRHNEVAPSQHEVAHVFEKSSAAVDHNILMMELMRQVAEKHGLSCLLHEKPFHGLNGSGKHANWSMMTDNQINLLDPTDTPENNFHFLILLSAILNAIHEHSVLLRASIGSASNDCRLGGHEAPPAIISVFLGDALEELLNNMEKKGVHKSSQKAANYDLGVLVIPELSKANTDRNRTSPFAFTGNKFEYRAVGSSSNPSLAITVLNTIVAESVNKIMDEITQSLGRAKKVGHKQRLNAAIPVLRKYIKRSKNIRFTGDNYSKEWVAEARRRKLPNLLRSPEAFQAFVQKKSVVAFKGILNQHELQSRYEILLENYVTTVNIEIKLMIEMFRTMILPAAIKTQKDWGQSVTLSRSATGKKRSLPGQARHIESLGDAIEKAIKCADQLEKSRNAASKIRDLAKQADIYSNKLLDQAEKLRDAVDVLEKHTDDNYWPMPKYRELLFLK